MKKTLSLLPAYLLACLSACGGASGSASGDGRFPILLGYGPVPDSYLGWTLDGRITLRPGARKDAMVELIAHELGHALGLDHSSDPECAMYYHLSMPRPTPLCPVEAEYVRDLTDSWVIYVVDADLETYARSAADRWNQAAGREILSVTLNKEP